MEIDIKQTSLLKRLPGVDNLLGVAKKDFFLKNIPKSVLVSSIRTVVNDLREAIFCKNIDENFLTESSIMEEVKKKVGAAISLNLISAVNATGVVVHTNLGRSVLAKAAIDNLTTIGARYSNLEFDLSRGSRGIRYSCVEDILCEISGAEAAMVVNNNAGAVLLCLETMAKGKKVVVSRGELVEIGGSFRIPDVMEKSGGILHEVGTTNRTHLQDYANAIDDETGLLLKVHKSNYSIEGFFAEVSLKDMVLLGAEYKIPVMEDLGSGTFVDFSQYGMVKEPTVQESVKAGADIITFSGDKLLGGPQAGIILGKKEIVDKIKKNPLTRALRIDKLTLAALESTIRIYRNLEEAVELIPTLRMLTLTHDSIKENADRLAMLLGEIRDLPIHVETVDLSSRAGGGALPLLELPSAGVGVKIKGISADSIRKGLQKTSPPIIGRIEHDVFIMDLRTVQDDELLIIKTAFEKILKDFNTRA